MAKNQGISYSADAGLIRGEGAMRQAGGFVDAAKALGEGLDRSSRAMAKGLADRENKQAKIDAKVANSIRAMKGNIDVTGLTAADQKAVNTFLIEQKNIYAQAANLASTLKPGTPEYTAQVDIMNNVNNSFVSLKENLNSYELGKTQYIDSAQDFSKGNNIDNADFTGDVFTGKSSFKVGGGGNLLFSSPKGEVDFKDINMPFKKNYEAALELDNMYKAVYSSGGFDASQRNSFETKLRAMAASNPDAFKSVAADGLNSYADYKPSLVYIDDPAKQNDFIETFIKNTLDGAATAAANGKAAKSTETPSITNLGPDGGEFSRSYLKTEFLNGVYQDVYLGRNGKRYYRKAKDNEAKWQTTALAGGGTSPKTPPTPPVNNEFADREEEIKQALEDGIDPKQVFTDATDEEITAIKEKYNIK